MNLMMNKVFGVGFHKTGTKSLGRALEILGYRVCGPVGVHDPDIANKLPKLAFDYVPQFDAFQDNPWAVLYRALDLHFPESKFILTLRPVDAWISSVVRYFGETDTPMRAWIYGEDCAHPLGHETHYVQRYEQHNQAVLAYFSHRPDDLLVLKLTEGEGWDRLCEFLGKSVPEGSFPHENRGSEPLL
jgi:hypothetical protein